MNFKGLQDRLTASLRERVRSGDVTERGLARITQVSQPHIHNVLNGKRHLSAEMADQILRHLKIDIWDLFEPDELPGRRRQ
jgi:transcriptional regulator with XRE-family HTH domain